MDESKASVSVLSLLDFDEWVNIPRPVVQALMVFKQCILDQTRRIADFGSDFEGLNSKVQLRLRNMTETLANTNEAIHNQQENIMKKVRERCEFVTNEFSLFKHQLNEENVSKQKLFSDGLGEMKEQVRKCVKAVGEIIGIEEITQLVNEKSVLLQQMVLNDVREQILRPVTDRLMSEVKSGNE
jgi:archaellum component FlaC